jgi:23S rRNA (adenine2503-C2)-methyltransferase
MPKDNLIGYTKSDMERLFVSMGDKPYRARQLFKWLYLIRQYDFSLMSDLPKQVRGALDEQYTAGPLTPEKSLLSSDGTRKFLFRLHDGHPVETVMIPDRGKQTVCVSTQAGCALSCHFCATGRMGLLRNLTVGEIVGQLVYLRDEFGSEAFSNVVFMGMGEPLQNFDTLVESIRIMTDSIGLKLAARKITVSTSGISPKIRRLADSGLKCGLALSLHAATQAKRLKLMPVAETFALDKLMEAVRYYTEKTKSRITIEYILFDDFNDGMEDVKALAHLVRGVPCKINILAYNPIRGSDYLRPSDDKVDWFGRQLYPRVPAVTVRKSRGLDIDAACGQLAGEVKKRS